MMFLPALVCQLWWINESVISSCNLLRRRVVCLNQISRVASQVFLRTEKRKSVRIEAHPCLGARREVEKTIVCHSCSPACSVVWKQTVALRNNRLFQLFTSLAASSVAQRQFQTFINDKGDISNGPRKPSTLFPSDRIEDDSVETNNQSKLRHYRNMLPNSLKYIVNSIINCDEGSKL